MILSAPYRYLSLFFLVIAIYYPAIWNPFNPMDDMKIATWLINLEPESILHDIVKSDGYYYRPILMGSYIADKYFWGTSPSFMHLENILIHALNVVLLYSVASRLFITFGIKSMYPAFAAGLLFALHPVNTESVNWIAGRSDLLAGFFFLSALWVLVRALERNSLLVCSGSFLLMLLGSMTKETALFFIPSALILIFCYDGRVKLVAEDVRIRLQERWRFYLVFLVAPTGYLWFRLLLNPTMGSSLSSLLHPATGSRGDFGNTMIALMIGIGFYLKKLIWPFPLNFAIFQIPGYYVWIGIAALFLILYFLHRRDCIAACFLMCSAVLCSALLALVLRPGWTPVAERYLYIPSACFALGVSASIHHLVAGSRYCSYFAAAVILFFALMAGSVVDRNLVWQDNIRLFQDVVKKSPEFPFARSVLADLLFAAGRREEAAVIIRQNVAPIGLRNADFLDLKRAELLTSEGRLMEARRMIIEKRRKDGQLYREFQKLLLNVNLQLLSPKNGDERVNLRNEIVAIYEELALCTRDPFYYYQLGNFYMKEGDRVGAGRNFRLAADMAPVNSTYKLAAEKLAAKMAIH